MQHTTKTRQRSSRTIRYPALVRLSIFIFILTLTIPSRAQWEIEDSHITASLRGIDSVGDGVAWASGTNGTVLRTEDGGYVWQLCAIPPGAEKLDFRGIQAFDANTAIVMSSGKGDLSRLYKTTDGCQTWKLVFTNPDKEGFWDAIVATSRRGFLIGDPVEGHFSIFASTNGLEEWGRFGNTSSSFPSLALQFLPYKTEALFAASNSVLDGDPMGEIAFVTGGEPSFCSGIWRVRGLDGYPTEYFAKLALPLAKGATAGAFSLAGYKEQNFKLLRRYVVVGGDYLKPDSTSGTSAYSKDGGKHWHASKSYPHGFRSAVAYDARQKLWITVGPNGTDISRDDGRNWSALKPAKEDAPDADKNWNALSLPFVVGANGRIGKLRPTALNP